MKADPLYIEILIRAPLDVLWEHTQTPSLHEQWDLRFSEIHYLPRPDPAQPQQFLYRTRIGFGLDISGAGESTGTRCGMSGERISALRFWSDHPLSLIKEGSGYWKYMPTPDGVRFFTWYDYRLRFGLAGACVDCLLFRPLMGWATAWSFDRLRLWLEQGIAPSLSMQRAAAHATARGALAAVWLYQGIVPKLVRQDPVELSLLAHARVWPGHELWLLQAVGWAEVLLGVITLVWWGRPSLFWFTAAALLALLAGAAGAQPSVLFAPFNPVSLTIALLALCAVALLTMGQLPTARNCRRTIHS